MYSTGTQLENLSNVTIMVTPHIGDKQLDPGPITICLLKALRQLAERNATAEMSAVAATDRKTYVYANAHDVAHPPSVHTLGEAMVQIAAWMNNVQWYGPCEVAIYDKSSKVQSAYLRIDRFPSPDQNHGTIDLVESQAA